jgi:hypothetical protein
MNPVELARRELVARKAPRNELSEGAVLKEILLGRWLDYGFAALEAIP